MLGPALRLLRHAAPAAQLDLLASPGGAAAAALLPELAGSIVTSPSWQRAGVAPPPDPAAEQELVARVAAGGYDAAVVFTSFSQSPWPPAYVCWLAGVPVRLGMSKEFGGALLSTWVPSPEDGVHQVDRALHLLERAGAGVSDGHDLRVRVPAEAVESAPRALRAAGVDPHGPYAVVLPGASCSSRRWEPARFAAASRLMADAGLPVLVVGTEGERELVTEVASAAGPGVVPLAGVLSLTELAAVLQACTVAVTNNSGGMHLADAVRAPLVALFAGTEEIGQYAPRSTRATVLNRPTACSPCRAFRCPFAHECLDVAPAEAAGAALALAERRAA
ncbi:glycosyltransferase family 9 protein [Motilibacter sp. E257]|uniref:Glycosyltransferase family 9 protein n=2 Tax=Motilibacter deserti TaxID=2714956 RepID=A0ABX0GY42_9ACTN|nr:glycosyltransferase family 9 protein [Motilibacter deserti]NHC14492.1 glycosyltransferase family 9 protein [Motilibacter deserti]